MAHAIIRIEKIKTRQGIGQRQAHNDRSKYTPNADESRRDFNQEYLNAEGRSIVELVDERMEAAKLGKPRKGAVLCLEVLMTGSPEAEVWQRDAQTGQAADMRGSAWEKQNLAWAKQQWGDNLVAMKLHQDEKTPHFQCFVVPIFGQGGGLAGEVGLKPDKGARLSARDMFSPPILSQLQTDFAEAMQPFDLERGIKGSRALHKTMRQMYALGRETTAEVAALLKPVEAQPFVLEKPPFTGREEWQQRTEAKINVEIARQVEALNEKLGTVGAVAVAATGAASQSEQSRAWADDSLQKADAARGEVASLQEQVSKAVSQGQAERERHTAELDKLLLQAVQGNLPANLLQRGQELAAQQLEALRREWPVLPALRAQADHAERAGDYALVAELRYEAIPAAEQQLAECRAQAQATPAGRVLLAELVESDRIAKVQEEHRERQAVEAREKERVEQLECSAREREADRVAQLQRAAQEEEAKKARQEAAERALVEAVKTRHRDTQMEALEMAHRNYGWKGGVIRVRVAPEQVELIQKSIGTFAVKDEVPGADGRVGVNIAYNPSSSTLVVSRVVDHVRAANGEVFERPQDASRREKTTQSNFARSQSFSKLQTKDKELGE